MGKAHSADLRVRVYDAIAEGDTRRGAARRFGVGAATAIRLAKRQAQTGSLAPARQGRPAGSGKRSAYCNILIAWVKADGDVTLPKLAERLVVEHGIAARPTSLSRLLRALASPLKKTLLASEADRADIVRARHVWRAHRQP